MSPRYIRRYQVQKCHMLVNTPLDHGTLSELNIQSANHFIDQSHQNFTESNVY